jgi:thiamine pyrophosphate-dependent enzyme
MSQTVSELLVGVLQRVGVKQIFGLIGDSLNPLADAVRKSKIDWIGVLALRTPNCVGYAVVGLATTSAALRQAPGLWQFPNPAAFVRRFSGGRARRCRLLR